MLALGASPASAQRAALTRAEGRVVRAAGRDTVPVTGARVVLHRIGREAQGPVDSTVSDAAGRFRFRFAPDTAAIYLLSARHAGIEYFSSPVHTNPELPDTGVVIFVADTSSTAPVGIAARHIVISRPAEDGTRAVLELIVLENTGQLTRVAHDTIAGTWAIELPPGLLGFDVGEGDFSPDQVSRRGDSIIIVAPIPPGQKQLMVTYAIPGDVSTWHVPFDRSTPSVNVMLEERAARVTAGQLTFADSQAIRGRTYRRYTGKARAGEVLAIALPGGARRTARWLLVALVTMSAIALLGLGWRLLRRTPPRIAPEVRQEEGPAAAALDAVAELDARYAGRESDVAPEEWARYEEERARLKAALRETLASGGGTP